MKQSALVKAIANLKSHTAEIERGSAERQQPIPSTQNDEAKLASMAVQSHERQQQAISLLQSLAHGHREIEEGRVVPAADVFAEIETIDQQGVMIRCSDPK
ncbi:hypothetical protein [Bordetella sp. N]|uniref:hypothetical protein n=1 Tax=Bordetella sp. N TaxID=1746199 RepID=UPI00070C542A|nr:hypothetical protein [Bordetella sp. N]ALM83529.1 prevent-host-death protein [Bordetella sp. N]